MKDKEKYIAAFLEGYFCNIKVDYGMQYYSILNKAIEIAENKWKEYKTMKNIKL